jgi:uncharacterized membrane protein YfcA
MSGADDRGVEWVLISVIGLGVGVCFGALGAGGSAFATPLLALVGVPAPIAVASPLPALLPASLAGAREYLRVGLLDRRVARLAVLAGLPAVVAGAAVSRFVGGDALLVLSGLMLFAVGLRMAWPTPSTVSLSQDPVAPDPVTPRRREAVVGLVAGAAFVTGLLANGGGFLLVPIFVLVLGFGVGEAAGTSMVTAAALIVPTLIAHVALGNVDWAVAGAFAVGVIPASIVGARLARHVPDAVARHVFGTVLVVFSVVFLALRVL